MPIGLPRRSCIRDDNFRSMNLSMARHSDDISGARDRRLAGLLCGLALLPVLAIAGEMWLAALPPDATWPGRGMALAEALSDLEDELLRCRQDAQPAQWDSRAVATTRWASHRVAIGKRIDGLNDAMQQAAQNAEADDTMLRLRHLAAVIERQGAGNLAAQPPRALIAEIDAITPPLHAWSRRVALTARADTLALGESMRGRARQVIALALVEGAILLACAVGATRLLRVARERRHEQDATVASLREAIEQQDAATRATFARFARLSHEAHTPSHSLLGMASLLHETPLSAQQMRYLRGTEDSARQLLALVGDVIDLSRLENADLALEPRPVDLARLLREVEALVRAHAEGKGLALEVAMAPDTPRLVHADPVRLRQLLFYLVGDALTQTESGHVHLRVEPDPATNDHILATVIDTGPGLPSPQGTDDANRVATLIRCPGTTSLGPLLASGLARLMGGDVTADRAPGEGSIHTASLSMPAVDPGHAAADVRGGVPDSPGRPLKVLVAEDDPVSRAYLEAVLDRLGHEAVYTENGEEALRAAQSEDFDIVLMDLHMPVIDGFAATRAIRSLPLPRGAMPVVALTADSSSQAREQARQAGMDDALTKPVHLPRLRALLAIYGGAPALAIDAEPASPMPGRDDIVDRAAVEQLHATLSPQKYSALLGRFFDAHESAVTEWRILALRGDRQAVWQHANALHGASLSLGLRAVADGAKALARAADDPQGRELSSALARLDQSLQLTRSLCQGLGWLRGALPPGRGED